MSSSLPHSLPPLDFDTIVVGAGIIGSGCAYKIAKSGRKTLLLEQFALGHNHGSSHGGSRIIRCTHGNARILPYALDAFKEWENLQRIDAENSLIVKNGCLTIDADWQNTEARANILRSFGVPCEVLSGGKAIQERFPQMVGYEERFSAVYEPGGGTLLADNCLKAVQRQFLAQRELAILKAEERVERIVPLERDLKEKNADANNGNSSSSFYYVEVHTNKGVYRSANVVIAAGGWIEKLLKSSLVDAPPLPLCATPTLVGVCFWRVKSRPALFRPENGCAPNLVIFDEKWEILYALPGFEFPNAVKFSFHGGETIANMDEHVAADKTLIPERTLRVPQRHIAKHLPDLESSQPLATCRCVYTMTEDENFVVDRHPLYANVFLAGGFCGTGFKHALTIGKIIASWINLTPVELDLAEMKINRKAAILQKARL